MKKAIICTFLSIFAIQLIYAQNYEKSVGGRIGTMIGASYKQFISKTNALEGIVDLDIFHSDDMTLRGTALFEWHYNIENADGLSWYVGTGMTVGALVSKNSSFLFAADGIIGLEYKLSEIPLCFSFDFNPKLYLIGYKYIKFNPINVGVTVRYTF